MTKRGSQRARPLRTLVSERASASTTRRVHSLRAGILLDANALVAEAEALPLPLGKNHHVIFRAECIRGSESNCEQNSHEM